jgi:two-component system, chemotaxis family, chemotaxis protein CheY
MDSGPRILVADDSQAVVNVVSKLLRRCGLSDIEQVKTAEEALAAVRARRHTLVISDCYFGGMSGIQLLMAMRVDPLLSKTCFILMTAIRDREVIDRAKHFQADAFLTKPFSGDVLRMKLIDLGLLSPQADEVAPLQSNAG